MVCGSSPGSGEIFSFPFFGLLVVSLRLQYLNAVSTSCWHISLLKVFSVALDQKCSGLWLYSPGGRSNLINMVKTLSEELPNIESTIDLLKETSY